ncbi:nitrate respiration regulation accessory nitrate sensor NreA [Staphylococcus warneri]|uniref:nitrate respiration regulation accessory nitrate sensor NreA n=1 Tax=Staphylococcus warneri TaxID=1292 RepID=UPI000736100C|nr:nitrate respiration regulation accessory nitrate sensor NreA [Staphylococcus warneri]KTW24943.1 NreA [Staphylococcus warneri]
MMPDSMFESQNFQENIDRIRLEQGFDFAALAFYESASIFSPIKWQYVSGNKNDRYKLIILRKGRGLAGNVMKTGKRMVIANVDMALTPDEKVKFPILLSENLTAVIAIPLWYQQQVYGVMLFGQRNHKPLPINVYDIDIYEQLGIFNEEI